MYLIVSAATHLLVAPWMTLRESGLRFHLSTTIRCVAAPEATGGATQDLTNGPDPGAHIRAAANWRARCDRFIER